MDHNFNWGVTVRKDIKKIGWGDEIESWESNSLGIHEFVKGFLAYSKVFLDLLKSWENSWLDTEVQSFLMFETVSQNVFNFLIDKDKLS